MSLESSSPTPEAASETPRPGTPVIVDIFAKTKRDGTAEFSHEWRWDGQAGSQGKGPIIVPKRRAKDPETSMHFHLRDETKPKRGFFFADKAGVAMWVKRDTCPAASPRCDDSQIPPAEMDNQRMLLKAVNINSEECTLHYRLWFKDKDGEWDSYDPEIINGGKGAV
jgi:hypothetical protein